MRTVIDSRLPGYAFVVGRGMVPHSGLTNAERALLECERPRGETHCVSSYLQQQGMTQGAADTFARELEARRDINAKLIADEVNRQLKQLAAAAGDTGVSRPESTPERRGA